MERDELTVTAQLARLEVSQAEGARFEAAVAQMLEYFSKMKELDVEGLAPTTQLVQENRTRADEPEQPADAGLLLANAPELEDRFIVIPNVL
ncbi:MAG: Asp-tRNA(Asn)/Glu-tRNA(Gln) amidotransferase subunit GatC [Spirochaetales bacterium]|nr:Asp-tRNA(Asn)/Glu-tRNA(Gln) amidotransferase subunit GatC [Spirochaetales bacterium]